MIKFKFIEKVPPFLRNKYLLTLIIFVVWIAASRFQQSDSKDIRR